MTQDFLDMPNGTTIKQELGGGSMPEQMRPDWLVKNGELSHSRKRSPDVRLLEPGLPVLADEQRWINVSARVQVIRDPVQSSISEEHGALLVTFADDSGLAVGKIDLVTVER